MVEERIGPEAAYWYERHLLAYQEVASELHTNDSYIVDAGCGRAYGLSELAGDRRFVVGVDRDLDPLLRWRSEDSVAGATCVGADVFSLPFREHSVDVVVSFQVIEHLEDASAYLSEIHRILSPGGRLFLTTPNARRSDTGIESRSPFHVHEYLWTELDTKLRNHFSSVSVTGVDLKEGSRISKSDEVIRKVEAADPLRLRRLFPKSLRALLRARLGYVPPYQAEVSTKDFEFVDHESPRTVDLFAICEVEGEGGN
jgi:SAM-dependent methyltransferase